MTIHEIFPQIQSNPIFIGTNPQSIRKFLTESTLHIQEFSDQEIIFSSSNSLSKIGIVLEGKAQVFVGGSDEQTLLNTIGCSGMFGIANLYADNEPFPTTIVSKDVCKILFIDKTAFCNLVEHEPIVTKNFLILQSQKIMYLNRKIMTFTAGNTERKVSVFISENAIDGVFTPTCSMSVLANMLGIGRASLYRALDHLIECGWIKKSGKSFVILDHHALAEMI